MRKASSHGNQKFTASRGAGLHGPTHPGASSLGCTHFYSVCDQDYALPGRATTTGACHFQAGGHAAVLRCAAGLWADRDKRRKTRIRDRAVGQVDGDLQGQGSMVVSVYNSAVFVNACSWCSVPD